MHVLGIDAGGTKTVCYLAGEDGEVLAEGRAGGANLQTEGDRAVEGVLQAVVDHALGGRGVAVDAICLGMAGMDRPGEDAVVRGILARIAAGTRTLVVNDALVALVAAVGDAPGIVLISGTGAIAYGRNARDRAARAGGWGFVFGDEGSGYWIAVQALRAVARAADGRGPATSLTAKVLAHFGVARPADLVREVYERQLRHHALAQVARQVAEARDEGDPVAATILDHAAQELTTAARSVIEQLGMGKEAFSFVLAGGVFHGLPWLSAEVERRLPAIAPQARVVRLAAEPALGAVRLALAEARGGARLPRYGD